ncbi:MAG: hypothetical protein JXA06_05155 [Bacteroidetes bacterium]|nr:hypothetical protein [Bacteroidota bacterium]
MRLSLLKKILVAVFLVASALIIYAWFIVRPKYESSILAEKLAVVRYVQKTCMDNIDYTITGWSRIPRLIISQVAERPNEGESILRTMMTLHPEIIQIRIYSFGPSDELMSRDTSYPLLNLQVPDSLWVYSRVDSVLQVAWFKKTEEPLHIFAMRMRFQAHGIPFTLSIIWNAKQFNDMIDELPLGKDYSAGIESSSGAAVPDTPVTGEDLNVVSSDFKSAPYKMLITMTEKIISTQIKDFLLYSALLVVGPMVILSVLGWLLALQIKRFINKMKISAGSDIKK